MGVKDQKDKDQEGGAVEKAKTFFERTKTFLTEVKQEGKKVTWPNVKETSASTGVILIVVVIAGVYLGVVDAIITWLIKLVLS